MAYINTFLAHFRNIQDWGLRNQASINLDVISFALEVKCRSRYFSFHPQFVTALDGFFANTDKLTTSTGGFAGWLPYRPLSYELSQDKLKFKQFIASAGLKTPERWLLDEGARAPGLDYILKRSSGSYGHELSGPFKAGSLPAAQTQPQQRGQPRGILFAEQYIGGNALKLWCWGQRPVFAHVQQPKRVKADGKGTMRKLVEAYLAKSGQTLEGYSERHVLHDCLAYQGLTLDDVPPAGSDPLVDYRYGRQSSSRGLGSDNALPELAPDVQEEAGRVAKAVAGALRSVLPAPVLYSLDGVIDEQGDVWWLEINSNPTMPPEGYDAMLSEMFSA